MAKLQDSNIDVHKTYKKKREDAYSGRTLDERVVNPFLHDKRIPASRGAFLSTFRRSVDLIPATREGLLDKPGFDALHSIVDQVNQSGLDELHTLLRYTLRRFIELRDAADVRVVRLQRISLEQYDALIGGPTLDDQRRQIPRYLG